MMNFNSILFFIATFIFAFCSLAYELFLAQMISINLGGVRFIYPLVIGVYIGFLGIGSLFFEYFSKLHNLRGLILVEFLLISSALMGHKLALGSSGDSILFNIGWLILISMLSGFELPLLIRLYEKFREKSENIVLASDYFGSFVATLCFPFIFTPYLSLEITLYLLILLNLLACLPILVLYKLNKRS